MEYFIKIWYTNGNYSVSEYGKIKSNKRSIIRSNGKHQSFKERILKPVLKGEYETVFMYVDKKLIRKLVNRIVAETFIPNPNNLPFVCHMNDDPSDNRVNNLFWGTPQDNVDDMIKKGRRIGRDKLKKEDVIEIRKLLNKKIPQTEIAQKFNVVQQTISDINIGKHYSNI